MLILKKLMLVWEGVSPYIGISWADKILYFHVKRKCQTAWLILITFPGIRENESFKKSLFIKHSGHVLVKTEHAC